MNGALRSAAYLEFQLPHAGRAAQSCTRVDEEQQDLLSVLSVVSGVVGKRWQRRMKGRRKAGGMLGSENCSGRNDNEGRFRKSVWFDSAWLHTNTGAPPISCTVTCLMEIRRGQSDLFQHYLLTAVEEGLKLGI